MNSSTQSTKLHVSTVNRCSPIERGGGLLTYQWPAGELIAEQSIAPITPKIEDSPNPRGGIRGARGLVKMADGRLIVSSYHSLILLDLNMTEGKHYSHPLMSGIHAICLSEADKLWITSTSIDVLLEYDLKTQTATQLYDVTALDSVRDYGVQPRQLDLSQDYRTSADYIMGDSTHLNSVVRTKSRLLVLLNAQGLIVDPIADQVLLQDDNLRGAHDLVYIESENVIAANDTRKQAILLYDAESLKFKQAIYLNQLKGCPSWIRWTQRSQAISRQLRSLLKQKNPAAVPLFQRGLSYAHGSLFVGLSPATVLELDWKGQQVRQVLRISKEVSDTVYGIWADSD